MKKLFYFLAISIIATSCSQTYYQICKLESDLVVENNAYVYCSDDACVVTYDFRENGGVVRFIISNTTDDMLFVDLSKSFFIRNGLAHDYFRNRTVGITKSSSSSKSAIVSSAVYGYWKNITDYNGNQLPGSIMISNSESSTVINSSNVSYVEMPIIAIPPQSSKVFSEYSLAEDRFSYEDLGEMPSYDAYHTRTFNYSNSPLKFINYVCYKVGEKGADKFIKNSFYIKEISNYSNLPYVSPKEFYIKYKPSSVYPEVYNSQKKENVSNEITTREELSSNKIVDTNTKEDEDIDLSLIDLKNLSPREVEFLKLKKIRYSLKNGNVEDMSEIKSEVDRISKWYNSISATYPEIHNILKEIKKLL